MNSWGEGFFGSPIIENWKEQLEFTTLIFRARGLHLDDRHIRVKDGDQGSTGLTFCRLQHGPVGSAEGVTSSMEKAVKGAEREEKDGASGKWVAHWKMVHIVRPVWEKVGKVNQLGREFPRLGYTQEDALGLTLLEPAPRTIRGWIENH